MQTPSLTPAERKRLVRLSCALSALVGFETIPKRDVRTGAFTKASTLTPGAVRAAWSIPTRSGVLGKNAGTPRDAFKTQLLAALRGTPRQ
jgi:hypothetical protein